METTKNIHENVSSPLQGTTAKRDLLANTQDGDDATKAVDRQIIKQGEAASEINKKSTDFWYAAFVQYNCECVVAEQISKLHQGIDTWVAMTAFAFKNSRGKIQNRTIVALHSYVFFRLPIRYKHRKDKYVPLLEVKRLSKVYGLVMEPNRAQGEWEGAHIPSRQIEQVKFMLGESENPVKIEEGRSLLKGDYVRVVRGNLVGLEGTVCRDDDGKTRIYVALENIGYAITEIKRSELEYIRRRRGRPCKEG